MSIISNARCQVLTEMIVTPPAEKISAMPLLRQSLQIAKTTKAKYMRAEPKISRSLMTSFSQKKSDSDVPILTFNHRQSLACQKTFSDISNNLLDDNTKSGLLGDDNAIDGDVDMDTKAKSNLDDNKTGKNDKDFYKNDPIINIEDLFQQVQDQTQCERLTREVLEQTYRFF